MLPNPYIKLFPLFVICIDFAKKLRSQLVTILGNKLSKKHSSTCNGDSTA